MLILKPHIFNSYPEIIFGFSPRFVNGSKPPFYFNLSFTVGDDKDTVNKNREKFFNSLGLSTKNVSYQHQIHEDSISITNEGGYCGESDALITTKQELGLAISTADCTPIFIYDPVKKIIAAVHSGWRGTEKKILNKTIDKLKTEYDSSVTDMIVYIGPSISQVNYEVGIEVAEKFDSKYSVKNKHKYLLDVSGINYDLLLNAGVQKNNIQFSKLCSFEMSELFHSYRRDGKNSGRSFGVIAMKAE